MTEHSSRRSARGVVFIHSAPSALCPHVEWALSNVLGEIPSLIWQAQPAVPGTHRSELAWQGDPGSGSAIASELRGWDMLRFEVTEEPTPRSEGARYSYVPELGMHHAVIGVHGDVVIPESRIKSVREKAARGDVGIEQALDDLLGLDWDAELEPFRYAGDGAPVRWLRDEVV
ncbi:MAG: DUF3145 domain-containing protein [Aeromicrobium sp.]|uniref:DUF3145 domain-containing protein n=1 Tax=Aeromicrobium sp. TaxID=1871063 RepID=UPI0039E4258A